MNRGDIYLAEKLRPEVLRISHELLRSLQSYDKATKLPADLVIKSLGFDPEVLPKLFNANDLGISKWGTIKIDLQTMQTNIDGVFAAGDIVRGASLVVWAIKDGRDAATQIKKYLKSKLEKSFKAA